MIDNLEAWIELIIRPSESRNNLKTLVEYFGTPDRPVTARELAEVWLTLTRSEEVEWIDFGDYGGYL